MTRPVLSLKKKPSAKETLASLIRDYPAVFTQLVPLKKGIHLDILKANPDVSKKVLRAALNLWCQTPDYQSLLTATGPRYDLQGNKAGEVTQSQVDHAKGSE